MSAEMSSNEPAPTSLIAGEGPVRVSRPEPGIALLTLDAPARRNALSREMMSALDGALADVSVDRDVAAVVLAANGPAFSAGHDLKELSAHRTDPDGGRAFYAEIMAACARLMQGIVRTPKPVIAAVEGVATAAGCQLVATCDLAVAAETATFATPGVDIGLFCSTPMVALSRNVPRKRAMEMLLLGERLSAEDAARYGLVNRVVAPERVRDEALAMARAIAAKSRITVAIGKEAFYRQIEMPLSEAYEYAAAVMVENMMAADAAEGICAFLEKRPPVWTGA
ncbi:MAG TPA: enoyl-CoA hydratase [Hyphomicrobium sp.]|nr:enoyl-CoA hydratase [Hyphomicrobium sp.]HRO51211.1 enoyl-CoA hydratase [Hyphomicrobium sp.]